jgi:hypothetical protein
LGRISAKRNTLLDREGVVSGDGLERYSLDAEIIGDSEVSLMKSGGLNSRTISLEPVLN